MPLSRINSASIANSAISAADIADSTITAAKIISVANTQITGNIVSSQITSVGGSQITANTIANSAIQTGAVENYMNAAGLGFGMRNRIINGQMVIAQRATSVTGADVYCCVDRFDFSRNTIVWNAAQSTDVPSTTSFRYSTNVTVTTASSASGAYACIYQAIEGYNWADLGYGTASAQTSVLSFWVKSSLTGTFGIALRNATGSSRFFTTTYTINAANTWEQKTITITGDTAGTWNTTNGVGLGIFWDLGVGSTYSSTSNNAWSTVASNFFGVTGAIKLGATNGATFSITGVQLEKGSTATSFDYRTYTNELQLCQRYFYRVTGATGGYSTFGAGQAMSTTQGRISVHYPVTMRATPTITYTGTVYLTDSGANGVTVTSILAQYGSESGGMLAVGVASGLTAGNATLFMTAASSGNTIQASAEL